MRISDWSSDVCSSDLFLGMVREAPALIAEEIAAVRARTDRPFGVNLIPAATDAALLDAELAVCFAQRVHSLCFFWAVDAAAVARAKEAVCPVLYPVGSVAAAVASAKAGAAVLIGPGLESRGHRRGRTRTPRRIPPAPATSA